MSPYSELIRLYGLDPGKERARDVTRLWLRAPSIQLDGLIFRIGRLSCRLGDWLIRMGQYLDRKLALQ